MGQHLMPRHLLKGFAYNADQETVLQYDKRHEPHWNELPIAIVSQGRKVFSGEVETLMASIEEHASRLIKHLRAMPASRGLVLDDGYKRLMSIYIAMFLWRRDRDFVMMLKNSPLTNNDAQELVSEAANYFGPSARGDILARRNVYEQNFLSKQ